MTILTNFGFDSTFSFGYLTDREDEDIKCISLVFIEFLWHRKTRRVIIGVGIPFVASVGVCI
jgi:hypothetical protein